MLTRKAPTISDVAHHAGVSKFTVSAVLNGARSNTRVSEATRQRIMASASALNYQPNASARNLARQRTGTVGVLFDVMPSATVLANDYASAVLEGIIQQAANREHDVMLYTTPYRDSAQSAARFGDQRTDGIIVVVPLMDTPTLEGLASINHLKLVAVSASPEQITARPVPNVDVDNAYGIALAVEHLVSLGHRRIAHITGNTNVYSVLARRDAFKMEMDRFGLPVPSEYIISATYDALSIPTLIRNLFALSQPPTAIVAGNDNIAIAALQTAREIGISVPEALSIVGFDDVPAASMIDPNLTTIRQPLYQIGAAALDLLVDRIAVSAQTNIPAEPSDTLCALRENPNILLPPTLIVRDSTASAVG